MRGAAWIVLLERYGIWVMGAIVVAGLVVLNLIGHWIGDGNRPHKPKRDYPPVGIKHQ